MPDISRVVIPAKPKTLRIIEQNPQPATAAIPGFASKVRFTQTGKTVSTFRTMALSREIPLNAGEVRIIDEGRSDAAGSNLTLKAPLVHGAYETGNDGAVLKIISACAYKHVIRTPLNALNGCADTITLDGIGASVELFADAGRWLVVSASPLGVKIK
jgi:hypothetical protein